jgi:hypothetical protein
MVGHRFLILFSFSLVLSAEEIVAFPSGERTPHGSLYKPEEPGPFPAVIYNHASAAGMLSKQAFDALGPGIRKPWMGVLWTLSGVAKV